MPDQIRTLNIQNRVASDLCAIIPPLEDSMDKADEQFLQSLRGYYKPHFNQVRKTWIKMLFSVYSDYPVLAKFNKNFKAGEIGCSGLYEPDFSQGSIRAMLVMDWIHRHGDIYLTMTTI